MSLTTVQSGIGGTGNPSLTFPSGTGTVAVQGLSTNIVSGTAVASTSGTSITFTGIPSWVKRITVMFNGVSTNGSSPVQVQIGSGSATTSGYLSYTFTAQASTGGVVTASTTGFLVDQSGGAAFLYYGQIILSNISSNTWVAGITTGTNNSGYARASVGGGSVSLSGTLDRVRITMVNGTDTFTAGTINILYE